MYGEKNPFNDVLSEKQLRSLKAEDLVQKISRLTDHEHRVLYYGPSPIGQVGASLNKLHMAAKEVIPVPKDDPYQFQAVGNNKVYFINYDMVQAEIVWLSRSVDYSPNLYNYIRMFNEYYGGNMSSVVFQTIRESKALAYSTFSSFTTPAKMGKPHFVQAYVGTQADKLQDAIGGMNDLLNNIPESENLFQGSKLSIKNKIETERIIRTAILFNYESAMKHNVLKDQREEIYNALDGLSFKDVQDFHKHYVAGKQYSLLVMGSKEKIDLKSLEKYGQVVELSLEDLFGY
jgi:predicted Zn-dependent peptidase